MNLANGLSMLSSQRPSFYFYWCLLSFISFSFISAVIFTISSLLLTLFFFCCCSSFSSCFRCKVRLLIWLSLVSWGRLLLWWTYPLALLLLHPIGVGLSCFHCHFLLSLFWFPFAMLCYAKSLQSCPTLCNPIDGSPPGSPVFNDLLVIQKCIV